MVLILRNFSVFLYYSRKTDIMKKLFIYLFISFYRFFIENTKNYNNFFKKKDFKKKIIEFLRKLKKMSLFPSVFLLKSLVFGVFARLIP